MTFDELATNVLQWANDRNLIEGSNVLRQYDKLVEEHGEYAAGRARGKDDVMADALGDKMVILLIMAAQAKIDILKPGTTYEEGIFQLKERAAMRNDSLLSTFLFANVGLGILAEQLWRNELPTQVCGSLQDTILQVITHGWEPQVVLEDVWNIIKDRKGRMVDGVFIKEGDAMMGTGSNQQ